MREGNNAVCRQHGSGCGVDIRTVVITGVAGFSRIGTSAHEATVSLDTSKVGLA